MEASRLALAVIAGLMTATGSSAVAQSEPISRAGQLTSPYAVDLVPSPKDNRAVLIRMIENREQFFLVDLATGNERQLTRDAADHEDPVWSPDGKTIAFVLVRDGKKALALIDPNSGKIERLGPDEQSPIHPSFSPDGKSLLYCTDDDLRPPAKNELQIYSMDLATKKLTMLISGGVNTFPVMSPDGRKIAYRKIIGDMNSEVFVADADGSNPKNLTNHWSFEGWPAWSPDGKTIAHAGNRGNAGYQIFLMNSDGSNVRLLAATEGRATSPKWAPDGKAILLTVCRSSQERSGCDIYLAEVPQRP